MSSARNEKLLSSTSFRVSLIHALLLAAAFLGSGLATAFVSRDIAERQLRARIEIEADGIAEAIGHGGLPAGVVAVNARAERAASLEYRLLTPSGSVVAGDLPVDRLSPGWSLVRLPSAAPGAEGRERLLVLTRAMPDGSVLTLGDDVSRLELIRNEVLWALAWFDGAALLVGLFAAIFLTRHALRRMDAIAGTVEAFARRELDVRVPVQEKGGDDIDAVARSVNAMLDHIVMLVADLRRVSAEIAHDLRTPLAQALQRLVRARQAPNAETRETELAAAEAKLNEALRLFAAMLRLAEIDAGAARARFANVDLSEIVDRITDAYQPDIELSGKSLQISRAPKCWINGDDELISQALANLIENAMRHTPTGSHILVSLSLDDAICQLCVSDNGPGLGDRSAEALKPFTRFDQTKPGTGLGLPIVAAVARLHAATLDFGDNAPGLSVRLGFRREQPNPDNE